MKSCFVICAAAILASSLASADGLSLVVQNDYFTGTDSGYSDGTELLWSWSPSETNTSVIKSSLGVRNRMYTPDSIKTHALQPFERPYCATLSLTYKLWRREADELVRYEIEAGVLGPHAYGEQLQTWAHRGVNYTIPQGWDDQLHPDEPLLNLYMERWHPLGRVGDDNGWQTRLDGVYGGAVGTAFIYAEVGVCAKAGWNVPVNATGRTVLANPEGDWFTFLFVAPRGRLVLLNATLGASLFHDRANERPLCPVVGEVEVGLTAGRGGFAITYSLVSSTREFAHQRQKQDYGNIRVDYTWAF